MESIERYRRKVAELVLRAGMMIHPESRAQCLATAAAWQDLALYTAKVERLRLESIETVAAPPG